MKNITAMTDFSATYNILTDGSLNMHSGYMVPGTMTAVSLTFCVFGLIY